MESEGCTCCQTRSMAGRADECARCGHLSGSHGGAHAFVAIGGRSAIRYQCQTCGLPDIAPAHDPSSP